MNRLFAPALVIGELHAMTDNGNTENVYITITQW